MQPDEAARRIQFHATPEEGSFLDMLRPYRGIRQEILDELEHSLRAAAPRFMEPTVDRELVGSLWAICHLGRLWATDPDGMLRRNNLITLEDLRRLGIFLEKISYATMMLLDGCDVDVAFQDK